MKLFIPLLLFAALLLKPFAGHSQSFQIVDPGPQPTLVEFNLQLTNARDALDNLRTGSYSVAIVALDPSPDVGYVFYSGAAVFSNGNASIPITIPLDGLWNARIRIENHIGSQQYINLTTDLSGFILQNPGTQIAGTPFSLSITSAKDSYNADLTGNHLVTINTSNISEGTSGLLFSDSVAFTAGEATISDAGIVLYIAELQILTVTVSGITGPETAGVTVNPAVASKLVIITQPVNVTGNYDDNPVTLSTIVLETRDAYDNPSVSGLNTTQNVDVSISGNPGGASLGGTTTLDIQSGTASFDAITINEEGIGYTLLFTSTSPVSLTSVTSDPFNVTQLYNISGFTIASPAPASTQYQNVDFQLQIIDAKDNTGTNLSGTYNIVVTSSSEGIVFNNAVSITNGAANITLALGNPGAHTLTVSVEGIDTDQTLGLTVNADQSDFEVADPGSPQYFGVPFNLSITLTTGYNGVLLSGDATVTVVSSLSDTVYNSLATFSAGIADIGITLSELGSHDLTVSISGITGNKIIAGISVVGDLSDFTLGGTSTNTAGLNSTLNISLALSPDGVSLNGPHNVTVTSNVSGEGTGGIVFNEAVSFTTGAGDVIVNLKIAATHTLTVTIQDITPSKVHQIVVSAADASQLVITQQPAGGNGVNNNIPVGIGTVIVQTQDAYGNLSFSGLASPQNVVVSIGNNPGVATLGGTASIDVYGTGEATFSNLTINKDGVGYTLSIASTGFTSITSNPFDMTNVENLSGFEIVPPSPQVINRQFDLRLIDARDPQGNLLNGSYNVTINETSPSSGVIFNQQVTFVNGEAQVPITITVANTYQYTVTLGTNLKPGLTIVVSEDGSGFTLALNPTGAQTAGTPFDLDITNATDATATPLTGSHLVTVTSDNINEGTNGVVFDGNITFVNGNATVGSLTLYEAVNQILTVDIDWVLDPVATPVITVSPGIASQFLITQQPASQNGSNDNTPLNVGTVILQIQDNWGNISTNGLAGTQTVDVIITGSPVGVTLGGTTTGVVISSGTASFSDLTIDKNGDYTLSFTYNGTAPVFAPNPVISSTISMTNVENLSGFDVVPEAGTKYENIPFDLLITNAQDVTGALLNGAVNVTVTSSIDGSVYNANATFTGGAASLSIPLTVGTHNLTVSITGITGSEVITGLVVATDQSDFTLSLDPPAGPYYILDPFTLLITAAKDLAGLDLAGDINVIITSDQADGEVRNGTLNFIGGSANIDLILTTPATHILTVQIAGITDSKTINVVVNDNLSNFGVALEVPGDKTAGVLFGLDVTLATGMGGSLLTGSFLVTVTSNIGGEGEVFSGNLTFTDGVADINVDLSTAGLHTLTVSIESITPTKTVEVNVIAAAASKLLITQQPSGGSGTQNDAPASLGTVIVGTFDAYDNPSTLGLSSTQQLTVSIWNDASYSDNAILGGTLTLDISSGTATFSNLTLNQDGTSYTLLFTYSGDPALTAISSEAFNMVDVNSYVISLKDALNNPLDDLNPFTFTTRTVGYSPITAENITVTRTGGGVIQNLSVGLSGTNAASYTVTQPILTTLDGTNPSTTFTLKPNDGLAAGSYSAVVTVTADNGVSEQFNVNFQVLVQYAISLDADDPTVFTSLTEGYSQITDSLITITNIGGDEITGLTVALGGTDPTAFVTGAPSLTSITTGLTSTFTIRPANNLLPGTYSATVTVNNDQSVPESFNVSFEVLAYTYLISLDPAGNIDFGILPEGYISAPEAETVTITRTGTGPVANLVVAISGGVNTNFDLTQPLITSLTGDPNATTFTVRPKTGLTIGTYSETVTVSADNMTPVTFGVTIIVTGTFTWTGSTNSDWHTAGNWSPASVPNENSYITISATANKPNISSVNVTVNNLVIESGAVLTVSSSRRLTVSSGGILTINPVGKLTAAGTLVNNAGSSGLIVKSDATGTGSILHNSTGVQATFERYVTGNKWHIVAPPVSGQGIQSFLTNNTISYNVGTGYYGMTNYLENPDGWVSPYFSSSTGGNLINGASYLARRDDNGIVVFRGTLATGTTNVTLKREGKGWNALGNPFPSKLGVTDNAGSFDNFLYINAPTALDPSYAGLYVWDEPDVRVSGVSYYKIINNVPLEDGRFISPGYLQPGQGFLVKARENNVVISFTSSMKAPADSITTFFKKSTHAPWPFINLIAKTSTRHASTLIAFNERMTRGLDVTYDAGLLGGDPAMKIYTRLVEDNGVDFAIQCLPDYETENMIIPVGISLADAGSVTFSAEIPSLPQGYKAILEDRQLGVFTDLQAPGAGYSTPVASGTFGTGRFFLHVVTSTTDVTPIDIQIITIFAYGKEIYIQGLVQENSYAYIYDLTGRLLKSYRLDPDPANFNTIRVDELKSGMYIVKVEGKGSVETRKVYLE